MLSSRGNSDNKLFIIFILIAIVVGGLMLLWGQYNSAQQVFEISFLNYRVGEQLANDEDYIFSEEEAAKYNEMLALAEDWKAGANGIDKSCHGDTVTALFGDFADSDIAYTVYEQGSDTTVFLLHGYNETAEDAAIFAPDWWEKGYNIIIPTLSRPMGVDVILTTFGVYEQYDIYDIIIAEGLEESRIVLHGRGTGAAAALLLAGNADYQCGIELVVSDSVYATLNGLKIAQLNAQFGLGEFLTGNFLTKITNTQLGFDISTIEISTAAAASDVPKFFVCGGNDTFISNEETAVVYNGAAGEKELLIISGAENRMAYAESCSGSGEYQQRLDEFINKNLQ